jgi:hypothetical protein
MPGSATDRQSTGVTIHLLDLEDAANTAAMRAMLSPAKGTRAGQAMVTTALLLYGSPCCWRLRRQQHGGWRWASFRSGCVWSGAGLRQYLDVSGFTLVYEGGGYLIVDGAGPIAAFIITGIAAVSAGGVILLLGWRQEF